MAIWEREKMVIDPARKAQIKVQSRALSKTQVGGPIFKKISTEVLTEYFDYSNVFSANNAAKLLKNTGMNQHAIKLEEGKQSLFGPIYSLDLSTA